MRVIVSNTNAVSNVLAYLFSFSIASMVMISTVMTTTSIVGEKKDDIAMLQAQSIANQVADAIVNAIAISQDMDDAEFSQTLDIPTEIAGQSYYIEISNGAIYVNGTYGTVSKTCTNYNAGEATSINDDKVYSGSGKIVISYRKPVVYKIDFGQSKDYHGYEHSPIEAGYILIDQYWQSGWPSSGNDLRKYPYKIPILINNTVPPDLRDKYVAQNLSNPFLVKLVLTPLNFDYSYANVSYTSDSHTGVLSNIEFTSQNFVKYPYCIDYWNPKGESSIIIKILDDLPLNTTLYINMFYGYAGTLNPAGTPEQSPYYHSFDDVSEFFDDFVNINASWDKRFGGPYDEGALGVAVDDYRNVYVAGGWAYNYSYGAGATDWKIKKYDLNGAEFFNKTEDPKTGEDWNKTIDYNAGDELPWDIVVDHENCIYVVGKGTNLTGSSDSREDWWIKKFYSNGTEITVGWNKTFGSPGADMPWGAAIDNNNDLYVVGYRAMLSRFGHNWWIKKFNSTGHEYNESEGWNKTFGSPPWNLGGNWSISRDEAYHVAIDGDNNVYVVGCAANVTRLGHPSWVPSADKDRGNPTYSDWWIKKFNSTGYEYNESEGWNKTFDAGWDLYGSNTSYDNDTYHFADEPFAVAVDPYDNSIYVAGYSENARALFDGKLPATGCDLWIKKFYSNGTEIRNETSNCSEAGWNKVFDGGNNDWDRIRDIAIDSNRYVYIVGTGNFSGGGRQDWWIKKFDYMGVEVPRGTNGTGWNKTFDGEGKNDNAWGVAIDPVDDSVYVVGYEIVNKTNPYTGRDQDNWDWWIKKFYSTGVEIINFSGSFDTDRWYVSPSLNVTNKTVVSDSCIHLNSSQFIITYRDILNETFKQNEEYLNGTLFVIDAKMRINEGNGSMIFLDNLSSDYTCNSYSTLVDRQISNIILYKYNNYIKQEISHAKIPDLDNWLRVRAYVYVAKKCIVTSSPGAPSGNETFVIGQPYDLRTYAPFENNASFDDWDTENDSDISGDPLLSGKIGLACGKIKGDIGNIAVDWIRVLKFPVSFQPDVTVGSLKRLNWNFRGQNIGTIHMNTCGPFHPGPALRDAVGYIKNPPKSRIVDITFPDFGKYLITIIKGDTNKDWDELGIQYAIGSGGWINVSGVPSTEAGEFKSATFPLVLTDSKKVGFRFYGGPLSNFAPPDCKSNWIINSMTITDVDSGGIKIEVG